MNIVHGSYTPAEKDEDLVAETAVHTNEIALKVICGSQEHAATAGEGTNSLANNDDEERHWPGYTLLGLFT